MNDFNNTQSSYSSQLMTHELFEMQVERTPNNIAAIFEENHITYKELNERANQLARRLKAKGVKHGSIVGLMVERSLDMVIGILGILKSGAAYLPIDIDYPKDRVKYILEDSNSSLLLVNENMLNNMTLDVEIIDINDKDIYLGVSTNLEITGNSKELAYVIYTSGTTGVPKGVMIEHRNLLAYIYAFKNEINISERDAVLQQATYCFDGFVDELYPALLTGAKVIICKKYEALSLKSLEKIIAKHNISIISCSPLFLNEINKLNKIEGVHTFISGGDVLKYSHFNNLIKNGKVFNTYGPTEATVCATYYECDNRDIKNIPIGKPIKNYRTYILDENKNILPIGIIGELYIAGEGVARGYINRPELEANRFVTDLFENDKKMYKTGDLARWLPDGNIEFLGRIDNQVKIRGYRVEVGEIESRILGHNDIDQAVVIVRENQDIGKFICAYIVSKKELVDLKLNDYLRKTLPEYMIPLHYVSLECMPRTYNGKLDRKKLPEPKNKTVLCEKEILKGEIEIKLGEIWRDILGIENVGRNDNFFEVGGHSLKATVMMNKIQEVFKREVKLGDIFKTPKIKDISKFIEKEKESINLTIERLQKQSCYETSSAQKRMYMLQQLDKESTSYNMPLFFRVDGSIEIKRVKESFQKLYQRHELLRSNFKTKDNKIVQIVREDSEFEVAYRKENNEIEQVLKKFVRPFDLEKDLLLRVELVEANNIKYLLLDTHHIISDGVSIDIFLQEFQRLYNRESLERLKIQYKDFAAWQNKLLALEKIREQEKYWMKAFKDEIPVINLPYDYERPAIKSFKGNHITCNISKMKTKRLMSLANDTGTTLHMVLFSAFNIILSRYTGQDDIVVGIPVAGRQHSEVENMLGMFVNTLAIRNNPVEDKKYLEFLSEVKSNVLDSYENQNYQFESLVEKLDIQRDLSRNPIFDVMFNMLNTEEYLELELENSRLYQYSNKSKISKFDLTLTIINNSEDLSLNLEYCSSLFKEDTVRRFLDHYVRVLEAIISNNELKIHEIEILSKKEKKQILYEFNDTKRPYPKDKTIQELFEDQVDKTPQNIAVEFEGKKITYEELNRRANQLARILRKKGVGTNSVIGVMMKRSPEFIIGVIGVLKAGGVYIPIDNQYPNDRVEYILKNSESKVLLCDERTPMNLHFNGIVIDMFSMELDNEKSTNLQIANSASSLAYIIYTSGTTGKPKGVMIRHRSLVNYVFFAKEFYCNSRGTSMPLHTSIAFDLTVTSIFTPLISGSTIMVHGDTELYKLVNSVIDEKNKSTIKLTPAHLSLIKGRKHINNSIEKFIVGGEELSEDLARQIDETFNHEVEIINEYGPTEATVGCTIHKYNNKSCYKNSVLIGKPIYNTNIYILGPKKNILPIGVVGELYISGDGLATGYLNNQKLTDSKFVQNPFNIEEKMYKSGDLARWLPDGNIEFMGRIDNQVKIRGFRIELGEIEHRLLTHKDINEVAVSVKVRKNNDKYLCAFVVDCKEVGNLDLKEYLKEELPGYMIPEIFVFLNKMPLTINGKIDREALPDPNPSLELKALYERPRNWIERELVGIWCEILSNDNIGINDNFFELGGQSLKAAMIIGKVHEKLKVELPLKVLFNTPTIKSVSKYIEKAQVRENLLIKKVEEKQYYEASSMQKRLFAVQQFDKKSTAYNMPVVYELNGEIDSSRIEKIVNKLIKRHESLRTRFINRSGEVVQKIDDLFEFKLTKKIEDEKELGDIISNFTKPFNLEKDSLFRAEFLMNKGKKYLMLDTHHTISDGLSSSILIEEFIALYNGRKLEELNYQYKDYVQWQYKMLKSDEIKKQEEFWVNCFSDEIPVLNMQYDYERPITQSFEGDNLRFIINEELTRDLTNLAKIKGVTIHMGLLTGLYILLLKYTGQDDIVIGVPVAGRSHSNMQKVMGMFVNTLPLRNKIDGKQTYVDLLREIKQNLLRAYDNQLYDFEDFIDKVGGRRDTSRNPLFDVMFNMENVENVGDTDENELNVLRMTPINYESKVSKLDLTVNAIVDAKTIEINFEYCSKLFKKDTIERMGNHYIQILKNVCRDNQTSIDNIEVLLETEKKQIFSEFNNNKCNFLKHKMLHQIFEEKVEEKAADIAIIYNEEHLTYRELNEKSNQLARLLRKKGVRANSIVGVMLKPSLEMMVSIMGILKAGGAYLPIDQSNPKDRINFIIEDSGIEIIITSSEFSGNSNFEICNIDITDRNIFIGEESNLEYINRSSDLAYVIYTSGSTGKPKGVLVEHKSIINTLEFLEKTYSVEEKDVYLLKTNYIFDVSLTELFGWFIGNGKVAILGEIEKNNISSIVRAIDKYKITHINFVPALLNLFNSISRHELSKIKSLRYVFAAGEELKEKVVNDFYEKFDNIKLENIYGPTEATIYATKHSISRKIDCSNIPIGSPIQNTKVYILNKNNLLVPIGLPGELCICGEGVARGYLNRPELTSEKFISNPFESNKRMYKTGDLARWLPDGNIEFLGRMDNQVKIRGFRVELGEIENRILQYNNVKEVAVIVRENGENDNVIFAYVVSEKNIETLKLKEYLSGYLPEYMIPTQYIQLDVIPRTLSGKIDKKNLPLPDRALILDNYEAPSNNVEEKLVEIWCQILCLERIGVNDSFFELGGHSLKAMMLIAKINEWLGIELSLKELFRFQTIRKLSRNLRNREGNTYNEIPKSEKKDKYATSPIQNGIWIHSQMGESKELYNVFDCFILNENLKLEFFKEALAILVNRHESLRTSFVVENGELKQIINENSDIKFEHSDLSKVIDAEKEALKILNIEKNKVFDLDKGNLFRCILVKLKSNKYVILIVVHHIVCDAVSMNVLRKDLKEIYNHLINNTKSDIKDLKIQFKDFVEWQKNELNGIKMKDQREYWVNKFSNVIEPLRLPLDKERTDLKTFNGDYVQFELERDLHLMLEKISQKKRMSMFTVLTSMVFILLHKYSKQSEIVIGTDFAGRDRIETKDIVGVFINTLLLKNSINKEETIDEFMNKTQNIMLESFENKDYPFDSLVKEVNPNRNSNRSILFDVLVTFHNEVEEDNVFILENKMTHYDLSFDFSEMIDGGLTCTISYNTDLFEKDTIELMLLRFEKLLEFGLNNECHKIKDVDYEVLIEEIDTDLDLEFDF